MLWTRSPPTTFCLLLLLGDGSLSSTIRSSVKHVGSSYIWLKNNMRALFKPVNADCTVIDTCEIYRSSTATPYG